MLSPDTLLCLHNSIRIEDLPFVPMEMQENAGPSPGKTCEPELNLVHILLYRTTGGAMGNRPNTSIAVMAHCNCHSFAVLRRRGWAHVAAAASTPAVL